MSDDRPNTAVAYLGPEASYTHQSGNVCLHPTATRVTLAQNSQRRLTNHSKAAVKAFSPLQSAASSSSLSPSPSPGSTFTAHSTFPSIFAAVQSREAGHGVVPVENSSNGPVSGALDLLACSASRYPDVKIVGEVRVRVEHCLLGWQHSTPSHSSEAQAADGGGNEAEPSIAAPSFAELLNDSAGKYAATVRRLKQIQHLHTHPQACGQCTAFLKWLDSLHDAPPEPSSSSRTPAKSDDISSSQSSPPPLAPSSVVGAPHVDRISRTNSTSTSSAAQHISSISATSSSHGCQGARLDNAAISSATASTTFAVPVLVRNIEDRDDNVTRFLILSHSNSSSSSCPVSLSSTDNAAAKSMLSGGDTGGGGGSGSANDNVNHRSSAIGPLRKALVVFDLSTSSTASVTFASPGALSAALAVFAARGLNLTSINARPSGRGAWDYRFVVECQLPPPPVAATGGEDDKLAEEEEHAESRVGPGMGLVERVLKDLTGRGISDECSCRGIWEYDVAGEGL